jgi:uncharacterized membrane protein
MKDARTAHSRFAARIAFALIALGIMALQGLHFAGRNYRDDEIRTVHAGMTMSVPEVVQWMSFDIHPPLWRVSGTIWLSAFGPAETISRFESTLYALLCLAFLYRLSTDTFGRRVALLAVFALGTHSLFLFYTHEFRPYAALVLWVIAMHWALLRWVRWPRFTYAVLYVLFCAAALYTHFFAVYALAAQVIAFLLAVRWERGRYVRVFALWILVAISFLGWLPSFLHSFLVAQPGGVEYSLPLSDPGTFGVLYNSLDLRPLALGNLLLGVGVLTPLRRLVRVRETGIFRFGAESIKVYLVAVIVVVLGVSILTDLTFTNVLTQRNLIIFVPPLALLAALGLRALPWQAALLAMLLLLNPAVTEFIDYQRNMPYRETLSAIEPTYQDHSPVVISVDTGTGRYFTFAYYLLDFMPGRIGSGDFVDLSLGDPPINLPDPSLSHIVDDSPESLGRFRALIGEAEQVWWISSEDAPPYIDTYRRALEQDFRLTDTRSFESYGRTYTVSEYRRIA